MTDEIKDLINFFTEKYKNVLSRVKSCSEPEQLGPGQARQCQQMWPRSGPKPVPALDQSEALITRQSGS